MIYRQKPHEHWRLFDAMMIFKTLQHICFNRFILGLRCLLLLCRCSRSCGAHRVKWALCIWNNLTEYAKRILSKCNRLLWTLHNKMWDLLSILYFVQPLLCEYQTHIGIVNGEYLDIPNAQTSVHFNLLNCWNYDTYKNLYV